MTVLNAWRPLRRSLWRYMQPIMGFQAACRTEYTQLDDHRICFWQAGSAEETVLLLHGFGSSKERIGLLWQANLLTAGL